VSPNPPGEKPRVSNRFYRLLFGIALLLSLYFDLYPVMYGLIGLAMFEGATNLRVARLVSRLRSGNDGDPYEGSLGIAFKARTRFEAERGWRMTVALMLIVSMFVYPKALWFFPWFMGFAIMGAGISGVCPVFLALKWVGLK
jgi:hypothetical protein